MHFEDVFADSFCKWNDCKKYGACLLREKTSKQARLRVFIYSKQDNWKVRNEDLLAHSQWSMIPFNELLL